MSANATHAYVTRCECGGINGACVDRPDDPRFTAREVAMWLRQGRPVERILIEDVRAGRWCYGQQCRKAAQLTLEEVVAASGG